MDEPVEWLTTNEVAAQLGVHQRTVYRLIDHGRLRAFRIGRLLKLRTGDVAEYLDSVTVEPGSLRHLYRD